MASSSTIPKVKYDVFLSFRGENTRYNFTGHLYANLCRKKIQTFIDDKLIRGEEISTSLLNAIEQSKISVIIFSEDYASSRWCLEELVKILECKTMFGQIVVPIFYYVDPSHVRNQSGAFGDGFAALEKRFEERLEVLKRWKTALREAANLSGWTIDSKTPESVLIEETVKDILKRLNEMSPSDNNDLIGVEFAIQEIESLLSIGSNDVCIVGIWGIGGIGKTTISRAIFNKYWSYFEGSYFAENVREESDKSSGLIYLRQVLFSTILEDGYSNIGLTFTKDRLARKKVFIVFDDVTSLNQIESLIENPKYLGLGSRIIITSRDKQVLKNCQADKIYKVEGLYNHEALQLFSRYAFGHNCYPIKGYMELSQKIVTYSKGVPLALKVLGSFLLGRTKQDWESAVNKLETIPHKDIQKVLKISYDGLDDGEKNIFLDIACFLKGEDRDLVIGVMDSSGFSTEIGLSVLIDKSLIIVSKNKITMHDLLQEMGKEIVRQESIKDPGKRSRLFHHKDIYHVLTKNKGTEAIEGICLDVSKVGEIHLTPRAFAKMENLRFLKIYGSHFGENINKVYGFQDLEFAFTELRYLFWHRYPFTSLPPKFQPENLVALDMPQSNVEQLWLGVQNIVNLKRIDLNRSKHLLKSPDLSLAKNLESLNLECCTSLIEIHSSIQYLNKLAILNLRLCVSLCSIPSGIDSKSLRKVIFSGCSNLDRVPRISCNLEELHLDETAIRELPSSIENLSKLVTLNLHSCSRLDSLPSSICQLKSLEYLSLTCCSNLKTVPKMSCNIQRLYLDGTAIEELPSSIEYLCKLKILNLHNCSRLESLPSSIFSLNALEYLELSGCSGLKTVSNFPLNIKHLYLRGSAIRELPLSIQYLSRLVTLNLTNCSSLESLPSGICKLKSLNYLYLDGCLKLNRLPNEIGILEALIQLYARGTGIKEVPPSIVCLNNLHILSFEGCKVQEHVGLVLPPLSGLQRLTCLNLSDCCITELPSSLGQLSSLKDLCVGRNKFESIPASIINLSKMSRLELGCCDMLKSLPELPLSIQRIEAQNCTSLESLSGLSFLSSTTWWFKTVNFINCFKVDQSALQDIVKYALLNVQQSIIGSCGYRLIPSGSICFPGSSIPEWFSFRSRGSFIELPPGCLNCNLVGLSLCTVISLRDYHDKSRISVKFELHLKSDGDQYEKIADGSSSAWSIDSDHIFLEYNCNMFRPGVAPFGDPEFCFNSEVLFQFYVEGSQFRRLECYEVKECGIYFYSKTGEEAVKESSRSFSSEKEADQPQSKRLKI